MVLGYLSFRDVKGVSGNIPTTFARLLGIRREGFQKSVVFGIGYFGKEEALECSEG